MNYLYYLHLISWGCGLINVVLLFWIWRLMKRTVEARDESMRLLAKIRKEEADLQKRIDEWHTFRYFDSTYHNPLEGH